MAFVNRSNRHIALSSNETNEIGPGQYLAQDVKKNGDKQSKAPFNINTYRNNKIKKDDVPGPGSYEAFDKFNKFKKLSERSSDNANPRTIIKSIEGEGAQGIENMNQVVSFVINDKKQSGFGSKEKRFKYGEYKSDLPGPGHYSTNELIRSSHASTSPMANFNHAKDLNSPNRVITIPSKNLCYGYSVNNKGVLEMNQDPDRVFRFNGTKNDSVGPGSYEINKSDRWIKNSVDWSKNVDRSIGGNDTTMANSNATLLSGNSEHVTDISTNNKREVDKIALQKNRSMLIKHISNKRKNLVKIAKENSDQETLIDKLINNETPGPGYYLSNETKTVPKTEQFPSFGSRSPRFPIHLLLSTFNNEVGPGYYYKDETKFQKKKMDDIIKQKAGAQIFKRNQMSPNNRTKSEERDSFYNKIGPGLYDPRTVEKKNHSNVSNFGSLEKRFIFKKDESIPGPGSYMQQDKWIAEKPINIKKDMMKKYEKKVNPLLEKPRERYESPPVGSYNPDIAQSMSYKINLKANQYQSAVAPFSSMQERFGVNKSTDLGPGQYYKDSKKQIDQVFPPFSSGDQRMRQDFTKEGQPGPGDYSKSSYFDWNKKSFNILYI